MLRSIIPFILACLGITVVAVARDMPLFDWEINEIVADLPPDFHIQSSPWTTRLGESVLGESFRGISYVWQVYMPMGSSDVCSPVGTKAIGKLSQKDELLERISMSLYENFFSWRSQWRISGPILLFCVIYIWWFAIWTKRPISGALIVTMIITMVLLILQVSIWRMLAGRVMPGLPCAIAGESNPFYGTITFSARLSKIHYEMLAVLALGVGLELGAIGVILRQIMRAIMQRKESAQTAVG